jgi:hypothetical protein
MNLPPGGLVAFVFQGGASAHVFSPLHLIKDIITYYKCSFPEEHSLGYP